MESEWRHTSLGDLVSLQRGHDLPSQDRKEGPVPIMGSSGLTGFHDKSMCKGPGVVVGRSGNSMGVVSYSGVDFWPLNTALYVTDFKGNDERYIYYLLSQIDFDQFNSGSAQKSLNRNAVYPFKVWCTTNKEEQRQIGQILAAYESKIELNRQMNTTLEAMAQALFKSWFVDFDQVIDNALAAGNPIPDELTERAERRKQLHARPAASASAHLAPGQPLPAAIQQQFPDRFVFTEEMGWVPEGWKISIVGDQVETTGGGTPSTKENGYWKDGHHPFCTPKDMSRLSSWVLLDTERHLTESGINKVSSGLLPAGAVLMSSRAPIGYLAINDIPVSVNQGVIAMLPSSKFGSLFLLNWAKVNMEKIIDRANGSTFLEISKKNFRTIPFLVPDRAVVQRFNEETKAIYGKILLLAEEIERLTKLRDTLLPKLLSGQLSIPEAEQQLAEVI